MRTSIVILGGLFFFAGVSGQAQPIQNNAKPFSTPPSSRRNKVS